MDEHKILRPAPRRPGNFSLKPVASTTDMSSAAQSPAENASPTLSVDSHSQSGTGFEKSRSILNLTSSTLFGIYSPSGDDSSREDSLNTPWGTGSQTPIRKTSVDERPVRSAVERTVERVQEKTGSVQENGKTAVKAHVRARSVSGAKQPVGKTRYMVGVPARSVVLCLMGLAYGGIVTQLHNTKGIAPVKVENLDRSSWAYLGFWAACGLVLGNLLPWVDGMWSKKRGEDGDGGTSVESAGEKSSAFGANRTQERPQTPTPGQARSNLGADWNPVVRSIGAFVGIAFAIRRLPWQSTLQVSLTLALANPVIWYLLDRSRNGLLLSTVFSLAGASALLSINPGMLPTPRTQERTGTGFGFAMLRQNNASNLLGDGGGCGQVEAASYEKIAVATWIASVLFCSCVCFGNIGRRLIPGSSGSSRSM